MTDALRVELKENAIEVGGRCRISCQRTLRIPDDGKPYPLPPGLGTIPIHQAGDFQLQSSQVGQTENYFFISMFQREALWLSFDAAEWHPNAVKVGAGGINAVSGEPFNDGLRDKPQDYLVVPDQPWLDGINVGSGVIRQFVAVPIGSGQSVEAQLTGSDDIGGIQITVFEAKPGRFSDEPPLRRPAETGPADVMNSMEGMALGAGGRMKQKIYADRYGIDTWDTKNFVSLFIEILNSQMYRRLTGREPPPTSISAQTYTDFGLPWFSAYDESIAGVEPGDRLKSVRSVHEIEQQGIQRIDVSVNVPPTSITELQLPNRQQKN